MSTEDSSNNSESSQSNHSKQEQWAGHYSGGGSDKVWAAGWTGTTVKIVWGRRVAALQSGEKPFPDATAAEKHYRKKVAEKVLEGYASVAFDHTNYGIPSFFAGAVASQTADNGAVVATITTTTTVIITPTTTKTIEYVSSHVLPLDWPEVETAITSPLYGISEKVNGERCIVTCDVTGSNLAAYNRKGVKVSTVPDTAQVLAKLGHQFVIDGERLTGDNAGQYVMFDLLEWQGQDARSWPYSKRISTLEAALQTAGLIRAGGATHKAALAQSETPGLCLLVGEPTVEAARQVVADIQAAGLEGIIVRTMTAPYQPGDTRHVRKFKFLFDIDCLVVGIRPGVATGSAILGLIRPSDGAIIEVGNVRSGLVDADLLRLGEMLAQGERPVLKVAYLPVRTVGIKLVEPKTSIAELRTDKLASECTTDQFGPAKTQMVEAAKPFQASSLQ
jgi:ATP-dependent DNA ligase/predicted DNA-binding WGR domain protein